MSSQGPWVKPSARLIWSGPGGGGATARRAGTSSVGARRRRLLPARDPERRPSPARSREGEPGAPDRIGLLLISGDEAASDPSRPRSLAERADAVIAITMFADPRARLGRPRPPGNELPRARRDDGQPRGPPQRLRRTVIPPAPDELAWIAKLAERFGVEIDPRVGRLRGTATSPLQRSARERARAPNACRPRSTPATAHGGPLRLLRYRPLFSGPAVERVDELQFQRPEPVDRLSADDAQVRGIARATRSWSGRTARSVFLVSRARTSHSARRGRCAPRSTSAGSRERWRSHASDRALVDRRDQGDRDHQRPAARDGVHDAARAEAARAHAAALRAEPGRAYGLLQPFADLLKMVRKEAFAPVAAIDFLYIAAPAFSAFTALPPSA